MRNPFTGKPITSREKQLTAIIVGIVEQNKPLSPGELIETINPKPTWSLSEIQDAIAILLDAKTVELTPDRKIKVIR